MKRQKGLHTTPTSTTITTSTSTTITTSTTTALYYQVRAGLKVSPRVPHRLIATTQGNA
ncbi:hypothetical protein CRUP_023314, partial [Coryphaenoides rupestris]